MKMQKLVKLSAIISASVVLTACGSLKNVDNSWCPPETPVERIALSADALFKFDKSSIGDLLPEGKAQLDQVAERILSGYATVESIELTGHTDRLGSEAYNLRLGQARAETVRDYLQAKGLSTQMTATSAGESQPVTTVCVGERATPELIACLQADRRVTVDIKGIKKTDQQAVK